jgi:hypothetical protein
MFIKIFKNPFFALANPFSYRLVVKIHHKKTLGYKLLVKVHKHLCEYYFEFLFIFLLEQRFSFSFFIKFLTMISF